MRAGLGRKGATSHCSPVPHPQSVASGSADVRWGGRLPRRLRRRGEGTLTWAPTRVSPRVTLWPRVSLADARPLALLTTSGRVAFGVSPSLPPSTSIICQIQRRVNILGDHAVSVGEETANTDS